MVRDAYDIRRETEEKREEKIRVLIHEVCETRTLLGKKPGKEKRREGKRR